MSEKFQDWCHKQFILIPNKKLYSFPFRIISLEPNALSHPSLLRFYALLERSYWGALLFRHYGLLNGLDAFKTSSFDLEGNELLSKPLYYFGCDFSDCCPHLYCCYLKQNVSAAVSSGFRQVPLAYISMEMI